MRLEREGPEQFQSCQILCDNFCFSFGGWNTSDAIASNGRNTNERPHLSARSRSCLIVALPPAMSESGQLRTPATYPCHVRSWGISRHGAEVVGTSVPSHKETQDSSSRSAFASFRSTPMPFMSTRSNVENGSISGPYLGARHRLGHCFSRLLVRVR